MKRTSIAILALVTICLASAWAGDEISFSGGSSFVSLQEGSRSVRLSDGARVSVDTLVISARWSYPTRSAGSRSAPPG